VLDQEHLWLPHKTAVISFMDEQFTEYSQASQDAFDELVYLVESDHQLVVNPFRVRLSLNKPPDQGQT
jgi:hypothetical protein